MTSQRGYAAGRTRNDESRKSVLCPGDSGLGKCRTGLAAAPRRQPRRACEGGRAVTSAQTRAWCDCDRASAAGDGAVRPVSLSPRFFHCRPRCGVSWGQSSA